MEFPYILSLLAFLNIAFIDKIGSVNLLQSDIFVEDWST